MKDTDFYGEILGLREPWEVQEVELSVERKKVTVSVGYREGTLWGCPESQERLPCHDHVERQWRHLDTCGFETVLRARVPRVRGKDGKVWTVPVPWAEKGSRFTLLFERFVVSVLLGSSGFTVGRKYGEKPHGPRQNPLQTCIWGLWWGLCGFVRWRQGREAVSRSITSSK